MVLQINDIADYGQIIGIWILEKWILVPMAMCLSLRYCRQCSCHRNWWGYPHSNLHCRCVGCPKWLNSIRWNGNRIKYWMVLDRRRRHPRIYAMCGLHLNLKYTALVLVAGIWKVPDESLRRKGRWVRCSWGPSLIHRDKCHPTSCRSPKIIIAASSTVHFVLIISKLQRDNCSPKNGQNGEPP